MSVSKALQAGFALAATIAHDPGAARAHMGIAPDVRDAWCGLARDLERASKAERRQRIRQLTELPRNTLQPRVALAARGMFLLAARGEFLRAERGESLRGQPPRAERAESLHAERGAARAAVQGAAGSTSRTLPHTPDETSARSELHTSLRPGFVPEPGLLAVLTRIARRCGRL